MSESKALNLFSRLGLSSSRVAKGVGFAVGIILALCSLAFYQIEKTAQIHELKNDVQRQLHIQGGRLESVMGRRLFLLRSLQAYVCYEQAISDEDFATYVEPLLHGMDGVSLRLAPNGVVTHMVPEEHAFYRLGDDLTEVPNVMNLIYENGENEVLIYPRVGEKGLVMEAFMPIFKRGLESLEMGFWGIVGVSVFMSPVLSQVSNEQNEGTLEYCLTTGDGRVLWGNPDVMHQDRVSAFIDLPGRAWSLSALPKGGWKSGGSLILIPLAGIPLSLALGWLVVLLQRQGQQIHERNLEHEQLVLAMEAIEERNRLYEENEKAWAALREKDALQRRVFESLPLGLILCDSNGKPVFVNEVVAKMLGRTVEETLALNYRDLTPSDYAVREKLIFEKMQLDGAFGPYEKECLHKSGERIPVRMHGLQLTIDNEMFICTTVEDISHQRMSERMLRDSQQTSVDIMEASPSGILVYQYEPPGELRLIAGNRQAGKLMGLSLDTCFGMLLRDFYPDVENRHYEDMLQVARTGRTLKTEQVDRNKDGQLERAFRVHVFRMPGNRVGVAFDDISEVRLNELARIESEEKLQAILNNTTSLVFIKDLDGRYIMANKSFLHRNNFEREDEVIGKTVADIMGEDIAARFEANDEIVLKSGEPVEFEETSFDEYGNERIYLSVKFALRDGNGAVFAICGIATEITERKLSERALRESEERYRTLVEVAPEAIVVFDPLLSCFVDVNVNAERLFGLSREGLLRVGPSQVSPDTQSDGSVSSEVATTKIQEALDGLRPHFEWDHCNAEGDRIPCEVRLVKIPGGKGDLVRATITDISERRRQENELRQLRQLLTGIIDAMPSMMVGITPRV